MTHDIQSGHGEGESGYFRTQTGVPIDTCHWQREYDEEQEKLVNENNFQSVASGILYCSNGLNLLDIENGREVRLHDWQVTEYPSSVQICVSKAHILAGPLLVSADDFKVLADFPEIGRNKSFRFGEQVAAPVYNGFIHLGGKKALTGGFRKPLPPLEPRPLYHIDSNCRQIRQIADDLTAFVMLSNSKVFYALRRGRLVCTEWESGSKVWERDHHDDLSWHDQISDEIIQNRHDAPFLRLMCSEEHVYLYRRAAFLNKYDAKTGELVGSVDSTICNWQSRGGARVSGSQHFVADDNLYIITHFGKSSETIGVSIETGEEIFHTSTTNSEEEGCFVGGDLIFYIDKLNEKLIARDRYNGKNVWETCCPVPYLHRASPIGNKVLFYSLLGPMACFEWEDQYVSPER